MNGMFRPLVIERLTPHQAPAYRALMLEAYAQHPDAFTSSVDERAALPLAWWEQRLSEAPDAQELVFGALDGEVLVGAVGLLFESRMRGRHKATLFGMMVRSTHRRSGLGARLLGAAIEHAQALPHLLQLQLTVSAGNDGARALYERFGFVSFGLEPYAVAVDDTFVSKVHMWRPLKALPTTREKP